MGRGGGVGGGVVILCLGALQEEDRKVHLARSHKTVCVCVLIRSELINGGI